ncbi:MAG: hypothetical protein A2X64_05905 [Ignavibacteria bacterium GWF2_33_9]|nr:MAG: hypothetical protein A2X64_05905 [Ignavibacteria bacterium GWF2_33_9]
MTEIKLYDKFEKSTCVLCGEELLVLEKPITTVCDYCGKRGITSHQCVAEHYICNECLEGTANEFIKNECIQYSGHDPIELAIKLMNNPKIRMHGAEHHFLVPAVMTAIMHNKDNSFPDLSTELNNLDNLIQNNAPKQCSLEAGSCGAAIGSGLFVKEYLKNRYPDVKLQEFSDYVTNETIREIDEIGLSRCCKRDTYLSLEVTAQFLNDNFSMNLPVAEPKCTFSMRNKSCGREDCPFFNLANDIG